MTDEMPRQDDFSLWRLIKDVGVDKLGGELGKQTRAGDINRHGVASSNGDIARITDAAEEDLLRHPEGE